MSDTDTIYARASAPGKAGVSVYRLSGAGVKSIAKALIGEVPEPRVARLNSLTGEGSAALDNALVIFFAGPKSFTGEDTLELHCHGSRAVEAELYKRLSGLGARLAEPGEFTLRALKNGKMDLPEVEALADLIDSETTLQKNLALSQLEGSLSDRVLAWRALLLKILTPLAADIDFPDEGDVPAAISSNALPAIGELSDELRAALASAKSGKIIREGLQVVLLGPPNAGKSSLMNLLVGSDMAIVSDQPGTTRDVIEATLDIAGMAVCLFDTAGLREGSDDAIELEGMRRTKERAAVAGLRILVLDGMIVSRETLNDESLIREYGLRPGDVVVLNKADLWEGPLGDFSHSAFSWVSISAKSGVGLGGLVSRIETVFEDHSFIPSSGLLNRERHVQAVSSALEALGRAKENVLVYPELAAEDLRLADRAFSRLVGVIDVEEVLGEIFSSFCIGK